VTLLASAIDKVRELTPEEEPPERSIDLRLTGLRTPLPKAAGRQGSSLLAHLQRDGSALRRREPPEHGKLDLVRFRGSVALIDHTATLLGPAGLRAEGATVRDTGVLSGVSHQRIAQLVREGRAS
jgi:hypothetical protein